MILRLLLIILLTSTICFADASRSFDGTTDSLNLGQAAPLLNWTTFSYSMWIRPTTQVNATAEIIGKGNNGTRQHRFWFQDANDRLAFGIAFSGTDGSWVTDDNSVLLDTWYHVGMTYDRTSNANDPIFYINGVAVTTTETSTPTGSADNATVDTIIAALGSSASTNEFTGLIAYVQLATVIWTPEEMYQSAFYPGTITRSLIVYQLRAGEQIDLSGNGYNGTLSGTTASVNGPPVTMWAGQ